MFLCEHKFSSHLCKHHGVQLLSHMLGRCSALQETLCCLPEWLWYFALPPAGFILTSFARCNGNFQSLPWVIPLVPQALLPFLHLTSFFGLCDPLSSFSYQPLNHFFLSFKGSSITGPSSGTHPWESLLSCLLCSTSSPEDLSTPTSPCCHTCSPAV